MKKKSKRNRNSQSRDPRTQEKNSQGWSPSTPSSRNQRGIKKLHPKGVVCKKEEGRRDKEGRNKGSWKEKRKKKRRRETK